MYVTVFKFKIITPKDSFWICKYVLMCHILKEKDPSQISYFLEYFNVFPHMVTDLNCRQPHKMTGRNIRTYRSKNYVTKPKRSEMM